MGKHMDDDEKCKILIEEAKGTSLKEICRIVKRKRQTISNFLQRYKTRETIHNDYKANKPRVFTERTERHLCRLALGNRRASVSQLGTMLGISASSRSIRRALKRHGICQRHPRKKPALDANHKLRRLQWARAHADWTVEQ